MDFDRSLELKVISLEETYETWRVSRKEEDLGFSKKKRSYCSIHAVMRFSHSTSHGWIVSRSAIYYVTLSSLCVLNKGMACTDRLL